MNFVDAAITLLEEAGSPVHVEELCRQAVERDLLSKPGANPLRSMKGRLTTELRKGDESRIARVEDDVWALRDDGAPAAEPAEAKKPKPKAKKKPARAAKAAAAEAEPVADPAEAPPPELSDEERELADLYADEEGATTPVAALSEYRDEHTADEDRAMLPEIKAERRGRGRERRDRGKDRKERKGRRERGGRKDRDRDREREDRKRDREAAKERDARATRSRPAEEDEPAAAPPPRPAAVAEIPGEGRDDELVLGAVEVLRTQPRGQALPIRQLTQMMRKQRHLEADPDQIWRLVKGVLVRDESVRRAAGLPPRVVQRDRDMFSLAIDPSSDALSAAEAELADAAARLEAAHRAHLRARLGQLSTKMLERIAHVYLHVTGWTEVEWIKRVDRSTYATGIAPGAVEASLVSVRTGPDEVDRRGVGELRAGLVAKDLRSGLLLSPAEMSEAAEVELEREGLPVEVVCGDDFVEAFLRAGVGVTQRTMSFAVIDEPFLHAVLG